MHVNDHVRRVIIAGAVCGVVAAQIIMMPPRAAAANLDLDLLTSQAQFKTLSEEAGLALGYPQAAPAEAIGFPGFDIGVEATLTKIDSNAAYWQAAFNNDAP